LKTWKNTQNEKQNIIKLSPFLCEYLQRKHDKLIIDYPYIFIYTINYNIIVIILIIMLLIRINTLHYNSGGSRFQEA